MELDELKDIWNKSKSGFQPKNEAQLAVMLKGTSTSVVDKLKRSVWLELTFTVVAGLGLLLYALMLPTGALKWTTVSILVLFVGYSFYYVKKLSMLNQFKPGDDNLKANLEKLTENLGSYLKFYKQSYTVLYPVYFGLGLLFGGLETGSDAFFQKLSNPKLISGLFLLAIVFFLVSRYFANWLLKKLYGNHLNKLKSLLQELNTIEEAEPSGY
jgi:uncharacterized membrane protein SirB2